jgi:HAE1 family hydrophobic/amphiphilic exporter-1
VPVAVLAGCGRAARAVGRLLGRLIHPLNRLFERTFPRAEAAYEGLLAGALRHRGLVFLAVAALMIVSAGLFRTLGTELIPPLAQGEFTLVLELPEGTPLGRTDHVVGQLGREIRAIDGIASVAANVGVSREGETSVSRRKENRAELHVKLAEASSEAEETALAAIREKLTDRPEISMKLRRPSLFTFSTPVEVDVYGYELGTLMGTADRVAEELAAVRGVRDIRVAMIPGSPEIRVSFDRDKLNRLGLRLSEVATTVQERSQKRIPTQLRVPCVTRRSITTKRIACSVPLLVGGTPSRSKNRKSPFSFAPLKRSRIFQASL